MLPWFGSGVGEITVAVLVMTVPPGVIGLTWTTSVKVAGELTANDTVVHVIRPAGDVMHVQPEGAESDTKVVSSGT